MPRQPNGNPTVYRGADGWYHTYVTVGRKPDGRADRRHIRDRTASGVLAKLEVLRAKLRQGHVPDVGRSPAVSTWLEHWLTAIAPARVRPTTLQGYESKVRYRIIPGLGHYRLDQLRPEHIEAWLAKLGGEVSASTAGQCLRILSRALKVATRRGRIARNPCELVETRPSQAREEIRPLSAADTRRVLTAAAETGTQLRWLLAVALGLRQGECLGLTWECVDLDEGVLRVRRALARLRWRHGCDGCGRRAASCPTRHGGGLVLTDVKSARSRRDLPIPPRLGVLLREHRAAQREERMAARAWDPRGFVFTRANGAPVDPRMDWGAWKELLRAAGVRDARVHDARHGAASTMRAVGMDLREVMRWLGHSQIGVTVGYTHVPDEAMRSRAKLIEAHLLQPDSATKRGA